MFVATCIILGCIFGGVVYLQRNKVVSVAVNYFGVDEVSGSVKVWLQNFEDKDGVFLGRISEDKNHDEYILYINNIKLSDIGINTHSKSGLTIQVNRDNNKSEKTTKVFRISTLNKRAKYIILNGEKIETSSIEEIR